MSVSTEKSNVDLLSTAVAIPSDSEEGEEPGSAPEALFYVLPYLHLRELLVLETTNRQLRNAIIGDVLLWQHLHVYPPLNRKFTDVELLRLTTRAQQRLQSLELVNCTRITEATVETAVASNALLEKLSLPGCTNVTPGGIMRMVKTLTEGRSPEGPGFTRLHIRGIYGITSELLNDLNGMMRNTYDSGHKTPQFYKHGEPASAIEENTAPQLYRIGEPPSATDGHKPSQIFRIGEPCSAVEEKRSIDVEVCPKCRNARMVYDCTRLSCQLRSELPLRQCKGCVHCIPRCDECGSCIDGDGDDVQATFCLEVLCRRCWLYSPKCFECNRAGCRRHVAALGVSDRGSGTGGVTCEDCQLASLGETSSEFD